MSDHKPYIVIFKKDAPASKIDEKVKEIEAKGGKIKQRFDSEIMRGFAAIMPADHGEGLTAASAGGKHDHIEYVEPDSEFRAM